MSGETRDSVASCELVNIFERLWKFDHHSERDLQASAMKTGGRLATSGEGTGADLCGFIMTVMESVEYQERRREPRPLFGLLALLRHCR